MTGDERETAAAYLALLERDSTDFRILHNLGLTYQALRDYEAQERLARRALRWSDSSYSVVWLGLLQALVNRGALAQAETTLAAARARFPDDPYFLWVEGYIAQNVPDLAAVDRIARQLIDTPGHQLEGNRLLADLHQLQGRLRLAEHYRREGIRVAEGEGRTAHVVQELGAIARGGRSISRRRLPAGSFATRSRGGGWTGCLPTIGRSMPWWRRRPCSGSRTWRVPSWRPLEGRASRPHRFCVGW